MCEKHVPASETTKQLCPKCGEWFTEKEQEAAQEANDAKGLALAREMMRL